MSCKEWAVFCYYFYSVQTRSLWKSGLRREKGHRLRTYSSGWGNDSLLDSIINTQSHSRSRASSVQGRLSPAGTGSPRIKHRIFFSHLLLPPRLCRRCCWCLSRPEILPSRSFPACWRGVNSFLFMRPQVSSNWMEIGTCMKRAHSWSVKELFAWRTI